jgi:hypothetical protein
MSPTSLPPLPLIIIACAIFGLKVASAHGSECSDEIARLEALLTRPMVNPAPKPMTPQSIEAQLHRQPTPESVGRAEESAQSRLAAVLARAKTLSAEGKTLECIQSVGEAKIILGIN